MTRRIGAAMAALALSAAGLVIVMAVGSPFSPTAAWSADEVIVDEGDNAACLCCHIDFDGEEIVEKHLAQKLTCCSCHGPSEHHRQDETLMARPDLLWGRAEVDAMCGQCHAGHKNPDKVAAFRAEWTGRIRPDNRRYIGPDAVCTDCHGQHTIPKKR